jgi:DtxR family Mn-dependent transcriptional regulator
MPSENREDYVRAIFMLSVEKNRTIKTKELADNLGLSSASVSEMIKKLSSEGLIENEPYYGFSLTKKGILEAFRVLRKHRLLEKFLVDTLELNPDDVHAEAHRLEHVVSDEAMKKIADLLKNPRCCPHNSKIPTCEQQILSISEMPPGMRGKIVFSKLKAGNALDRLNSMGLVPDSEITVVRKLRKGPIIIKLKGSELALDNKIAAQFYIET